jgi:hypothetical protein
MYKKWKRFEYLNRLGNAWKSWKASEEMIGPDVGAGTD